MSTVRPHTLTIWAMVLTWLAGPVLFLALRSFSGARGGFSTENFFVLFGGRTAPGFGAAVLNSVVVGVGTTTVSVAIGVPAGLALSYMAHRWRHVAVLLSARVVPPIAVAVPIAAVLTGAGLYDTAFGLCVVHVGIALPIVVALVAARSIRDVRPLEELALLDGCAAFSRAKNVILPQMLPTVLVAAFVAFVTSWTDLFYALMLTGAETTTAPMIMSGFQTIRSINWGMLSAACVAVSMPPVVLAMLVWRSSGVRSVVTSWGTRR